MSYSAQNPTTGNQYSSERNTQQRRNDHNNGHPEKSYYIPRGKKEQTEEHQTKGPYEQRTDYKNNQEYYQRRDQPYRDYKSNYRNEYNNDNYGEAKTYQKKTESGANTKDEYREQGDYVKKNDTYNKNETYSKGNFNSRNGQYEGERRYQKDRYNYNDDNTQSWPNATETVYSKKTREESSKKAQQNDELRKDTKAQNERKHSLKEQSGKTVEEVSKQSQLKSTEEQNQKNYYEVGDNRNAQQNTTSTKQIQNQQKENTISSTPATSNHLNAASKENTTAAVSTQPMVSTNYIHAPVSTEQNRMMYAPGNSQLVQIPVLFQTPYIVFPQPSGLSVVQPLYQVPASPAGLQGNTNQYYSVPTNLVNTAESSTNDKPQASPQFITYPQLPPNFFMNPMMNHTPMMQPFYVIPPTQPN